MEADGRDVDSINHNASFGWIHLEVVERDQLPASKLRKNTYETKDAHRQCTLTATSTAQKANPLLCLQLEGDAMEHIR